jgi:hypothetical protein
MWDMWNITSFHLETVLVLEQDGCMFCAKHTDEDIIGSKMTMPTTSIPKVQPFYMRLIIDAFDD